MPRSLLSHVAGNLSIPAESQTNIEFQFYEFWEMIYACAASFKAMRNNMAVSKP